MATTKLSYLSKFMLQVYSVAIEKERELLVLVSDFMVNSRLKILYVISMEFMECLIRMHRRRKRTLSVHMVIWSFSAIFTTCANLLDTISTYEFYGFNDDLRHTIN